jgi:FMN reductase
MSTTDTLPHKLIFVAGSPSATSRSSRLLEAVAKQLQTDGVEPRFYTLANFDASELLHGQTNGVAVQHFIADVQTSQGLVVATPVYKGTFAGALKVIIDVIPPDALVGKVALGIATARLPSHLNGAGVGLAGIFDFFKIARSLPPLLLADEVLLDPHDPANLSDTAQRAVGEAVSRIRACLP